MTEQRIEELGRANANVELHLEWPTGNRFEGNVFLA